jgi:microcystin-dependent protein
LLLSGNMTEATEGAHQYRAATVGTAVMSALSGSLNARLGNNTTDASGHHAHYFDIPRFTSSPSGSGRPHNNMPPFYVLAFIMRVR